MKKIFKMFCFLLMFFVLVNFCVYAVSEQTPGGILKIGIGTDVTSFDMATYRSGVDQTIGALVFDVLVAWDRTMKNFVPRLATSWEQVDDLTWIFNLREGVKFTDGTPFNAECVKFSLERVSTAVRGIRFHGMISHVNILDDYKVEVKLKEPSASFFPNLTKSTGAIYTTTAVEQYGEDLFKNPVGTGLFKLEEWIPGQRIVLVRNDEYWGTPAKLEKVIFYPIPTEASRVMAFKGGDLDVIEQLPAHEVAAMERDPNYKLFIAPMLRTIWIGFNFDNPILRDVRIRKAIAHAIDRESIIKYTMENLAREANLGLLPPEVMKTDPPLSLNYDPELSKKLLAEAGYVDGLELTFWTTEGRYPKDVEIAQVAQSQLLKVGINTSIQVMDYSSYVAALSRSEHQIFLLGWGVTIPPDTFFRACFYSTDTSNWTHYKNEEVDKMIDEAVKIMNEEERNKAYYELNKRLVVEEAVVFPIYYASNIYALRSNIEEFYATPNELFDLSQTWIK